MEIETLDAELVTFNALPMREKIASLTADLLRDADSHMEFSVRHSFAPGMYIREIFIPAGALLVGKVHKVECVNVCSQGDIDICTEQGSFRVQAPFTAVSAAGTQKIGYAYTDTVWVNIFKTDETDIAKLEASLIYSDAEAVALLDPEGKYFTVKELECQ